MILEKHIYSCALPKSCTFRLEAGMADLRGQMDLSLLHWAVEWLHICPFSADTTAGVEISRKLDNVQKPLDIVAERPVQVAAMSDGW